MSDNNKIGASPTSSDGATREPSPTSGLGPDGRVSTDALLALAQRCEERAGHMEADAEMMDLEFVSMVEASERKWGAYQHSPSDLTRRNHIVFMDRKNALGRSIKTTIEDAEHYRACAAALRARATQGGVA